ncbi:class I SAM-dependent methyltransferase [Pyramidobacter sp. YE332]|uniref:class I SAM-dependent methyltransferase n=1 Tax=Pyramidobacter sp. YE332 TaxID=3068894 RepID=UPI00294B5822|nr:class I SAM-dependent methyltransferase [Pyramidobacter sp. YE332]WOL40965.1 class I SAM-dependent methyltransferase [Pyramidobacter sp. YE332]
MLRTDDNYQILQPMYPLLIQQFVDDYRLQNGIAVDIGVGPGWLGMELAKITDMRIVFLDISRDSLDLAKKNYEALPVDNEVSFVQADVCEMPLEDDSVDFVMSRGSIWFWERPEEGLRAVHRILKPGCFAVVGGGLGRYIPPSMRERMQKAVQAGLKRRNEKRPSLVELAALVERAGLTGCRVVSDGEHAGGRWIEIEKKK